MSCVKIVNTDQFFFEEQNVPRPIFEEKDYQVRIDRLLKEIKSDGLDFVVIYGDREHFANIEYFSSYDCRFEEGLLIISREGEKSIVTGNEGYAYSFQIPYEIKRYLYQNFSLQGQPRNKSNDLDSVLRSVGLNKKSKIGVVGYKYFYEDEKHIFDLPQYIMETLYDVGDKDNIINYTNVLTGLDRGIRLKITTAKEVAWAEYQAIKCCGVVKRIICNLREGITESEAAQCGRADFSPISMFGLVNFGPKNVSIGLRSGDDTRLHVGEVCGICYAIRGSLCSRNAIAAYDFDSCNSKLKERIEDFYMEYWKAVATWLESVKVNESAGIVYDKVMSIIGDARFNVALNPGHNTATDEWVNSPFYKNSKYKICSGSYFQSDMIASSNDPVMSAICEDTVIVADENLRSEINKEYPELYARILRRQTKMRNLLGINVDDSLLPMCNFTGAYFPFVLNPKVMFKKNN
ncbi:hypothetical protein HRI96_06875 [Treponema parvum]|uniref:Creatinase N-terminal domain-containing protein n=1 Tax=Treponema parvum TaxID=138851 RepID=A0A975ICF7_9SPIR|nr:aminopeptidase P family N-terminal domain-containing protein [Treponema parvum]QTQ11941.1 hypothetical protein HRI96_06875 [Treponema parvum]